MPPRSEKKTRRRTRYHYPTLELGGRIYDAFAPLIVEQIEDCHFLREHIGLPTIDIALVTLEGRADDPQVFIGYQQQSVTAPLRALLVPTRLLVDQVIRQAGAQDHSERRETA